MYAIHDIENDDYYSAKFEYKEDAELALQELCYENEWEEDNFAVIKL